MLPFLARRQRWLPVVVAAVSLLLWVGFTRGIVTIVPSRTETFATNPYAVLIAVGIAIAVAMTHRNASAALVLVSLLLVVQFLFWPARFSQVSWTAYLGLPLVAAGVFLWGAPPIRRLMPLTGFAWSIAAAALLTVPALSLSGTWGTINGKPPESAEVLQGFSAWAVVGILVTFALWRTIRPARDPRVTTAASSPPGGQQRELADSRLHELSVRERDIFVLVARGLSNAEVAREAHIEESTVKTHLTSILTKLGLTSRVQVVAYAYEHGIHPLASATSTDALS